MNNVEIDKTDYEVSRPELPVFGRSPLIDPIESTSLNFISQRPTLPSILEAVGYQMSHVNGIEAVAVRAGRRSWTYGKPTGDPVSEFNQGSISVQLWGNNAPLVDVVMSMAVLIDMRESEVAELAEALADSNDRQIRLYDLAQLHSDALDLDTTISKILGHARSLTNSSVSGLLGEDRTLTIDGSGSPELLAWLEKQALQYTNDLDSLHYCIEGKSRALIRNVFRNTSVMLVVARTNGEPYSNADRKITDALGGALASAMKISQMHSQRLTNAVLENEHATAAELASAVINLELDQLPGAQVVATTIPARNVGGDFYTAILKGDTYRFVVGDVSGKGLPAAVLMTNAVNSANSVLNRVSKAEPTYLLEAISQDLEQLLTRTHRFITMLVGTAKIIEGGKMKVSLSNAGHSPVFVSVDGVISMVPPSFPPVGVIPIVAQPGKCLDYILGAKDYLFIGSDGLVEQENVSGELFGIDRLTQAIVGATDATDIVTSSIGAVSLHGGVATKSDDQTVFVISVD